MMTSKAVLQIPKIRVPDIADVIGRKIEDASPKTIVKVTMEELREESGYDEEDIRKVVYGILGIIKGRYIISCACFSLTQDAFIVRI